MQPSGRVVRVPKLFADHATRIGKVLHRRDERLGIAARDEFIMTAFSGQDRPATAHARPVESAGRQLLFCSISHRDCNDASPDLAASRA